MNDNLNEFLVDLVSNPGQLQAFLADPDRTLAASRLTPDEREAIRSRDPRRLSAALNTGLHLESNNNNVAIRRPTRRKKGGSKKSGGTKKRGTRKGGTKKGGRKGGSKSR